MVKIRLRRMGNKHRPFYRIVVAKSAAGRNGSFIEVLGTYNPLTRPSTIALKGDRALEWLMSGAQPTETVAVILKREGVLESFFEARPAARKDYKFLDKRVAPTAAAAVAVAAPVEEASAAAETAPAEAPVAEAPVAEATATEAPAESPAETPAEPAPAAPEETA